MAGRAAYEHCHLQEADLRETNEELGRGSYARVMKVYRNALRGEATTR